MAPQSFLLIALALSAVSVGAVSINKRITGGENAREGEFPSIVSLDAKCAGILLDSTTVLTAEHCAIFDSFDELNSTAVVKAGVANLADKGVISKYIRLSPEQKKLVDLPADKDARHPNDIAIVKLVTPINETKTIKYAKLPKASSDPKVNSTAVAVGWGGQSAFHSRPVDNSVKKLSKVVIRVHSRQTCVNYNPTMIGSRDTIVCAGGDGKGVCNGDSGGPLFDKETGELIGITSFTMRRDKNSLFCSETPAIFVRVASYMDFINANLGGAGGLPGGLPAPDYAWMRRTATVLERSCEISSDKAACAATVQPCLAEVKPDTDGEDLAATRRFLKRCAHKRMACAVRVGPEHDQCIDRMNKCFEEEFPIDCYRREVPVPRHVINQLI